MASGLIPGWSFIYNLSVRKGCWTRDIYQLYRNYIHHDKVQQYTTGDYPSNRPGDISIRAIGAQSKQPCTMQLVGRRNRPSKQRVQIGPQKLEKETRWISWQDVPIQSLGYGWTVSLNFAPHAVVITIWSMVWRLTHAPLFVRTYRVLLNDSHSLLFLLFWSNLQSWRFPCVWFS